MTKPPNAHCPLLLLGYLTIPYKILPSLVVPFLFLLYNYFLQSDMHLRCARTRPRPLSVKVNLARLAEFSSRSEFNLRLRKFSWRQSRLVPCPLSAVRVANLKNIIKQKNRYQPVQFFSSRLFSYLY